MGDDEEVEGVGEVGGVDGRVGGWGCGGEVHAAVGQGVLEDGEQGEVVGGVEGGVWGEEETGVVGVLGGGAAGEVDFLEAGFGGGEELLDDEGVFFGGGVGGGVEERVGDGAWGLISWVCFFGSVCWLLTWGWLTFVQSGENLTEGDIRVACTCSKGTGVVRSVFGEDIREQGFVT